MIDIMIRDSIVTGLLFGDEGKGTLVDYLASENRPESVVRYSGGSQAAHNIVMSDGKHHTFAQFGSASLRGVPTTLSRFMLVNPLNLVVEGDVIYEKTGWNPFPDLMISAKSLMTTPVHVWLNRKREEARGASAHGSCGVGIGETRYFHIRQPDEAPFMADLYTPALLESKLRKLVDFAEQETGLKYDGIPVAELMESYRNLADDAFLNVAADEEVTNRLSNGYHVFEGSQGVLLDESLGFHPHTTWSSTVSKNAQVLLEEAGKPAGKVTGVIRSYFTRHGFGPFPSEIPMDEKNSELFPEGHNQYGRYQGGWRLGWFDFPLFDYALRANQQVDELAVTHMDRFFSNFPVVTGYTPWKNIPSDFFNRDREKQEEVTRFLLSGLTREIQKLGTEEDFVAMVEETSKTPVGVLSYGPTAEEKTRR